MKLDRRSLTLALASAMLLAVAVYANSLGNGFALDDEAIIQHNEQVHGVRHLLDAVTGPYWPGEPAERGLFRPLTLATYAFDWSIGGGSAWPFHLVNVLLHATVTGLVLLLLLSLSGDLAAAWVGALIFAVHPVHVEAVANIVGRAEILAALFFLVGVLLFLRSERRRWGVAAAVALAFFLALASKENAIMLPAVLLLATVWRAPDLRAGVARTLSAWRVYAGMAVAAAVYFALRRANIGTFLGAEKPAWFWGMPEQVRLLTAIRVWPEYLRLMVVPFDLVPDYGPGVIVPQTGVLQPLVLIGLVTGALAALVAWKARRTAPLLTAGIVWFAVTVLPVTGILFPVGIILAERTLYLPSVGVALAVAGAVQWARARRGAWRPALAAALLVLCAGAGRTWTANPTWRDTVAVMNHLARHHAVNYRAQWAAAASLEAKGDTAAALDRLELATRMVPGYYALRIDYGTLLSATHRYGAAAAQFDTALQLIPTSDVARLNEVATLILDDRPGEAAAVAEAGLSRSGAGRLLYQYYSRALARDGRFPEAVEAWERAIEVDGDSTGWVQWGHLAGIALLAGDTVTTRRALAEARSVAPAGVDVPSVEEMSRRLSERGKATIPLW